MLVSDMWIIGIDRQLARVTIVFVIRYGVRTVCILLASRGAEASEIPINQNVRISMLSWSCRLRRDWFINFMASLLDFYDYLAFGSQVMVNAATGWGRADMSSVSANIKDKIIQG